MKISVVIPVYNAAPYVEAALRSVWTAAAHTDADVEAVCVDDGSTDASGALLDALAAAEPRLRVLHQPNGGEGAARTAGTAAASGDLVAFLDADDAFHPKALAAFAEAARRTNADVIRYGWRPVHSQDTPFPDFDVHASVRLVDLSARDDSLVSFCQLGTPTVISRELAGQVKWTSLTQGADMVFLLDCLKRARRVAYVDAPLLNYLTHAESISRRLTAALLTGTCAYLPLVWKGCRAVGESPSARLKTARFIAGFALLRLPGSWKKLSAPEDQATVRAAYGRLLRALADDDDLFRPWVRRALSRASRTDGSSPTITVLRLLYRALKSLPSLWFAPLAP